MDNRIERIVLETDRHRIVGDLTLPRDGYRSRLSDYLNQGEIAFIPLTDAEIEVIEEPGRGRAPRRSSRSRASTSSSPTRPATAPGPSSKTSRVIDSP